MDVVAGDGGKKKLQSAVLDAFPSESKPVGVNAAFAALEQLKSSELYKFAGTAAKGDVNSAFTIVAALQSGRAPQKPSDSTTDFCTQMWTRLPCFVQFKSCPAGKDEKEAVQLFGSEALKAKWELLKKRPSDKLTLQDLDEMNCFAFLLTSDVHAELKKLSAQVLASTPTTPAAKRPPPKEEKSGKPPAKRTKAEASEPKSKAANFLGI
eukprot:6462423-Amphidinium_carterae.1